MLKGSEGGREDEKCEEERLKEGALGAPGLGSQEDKQEPARSPKAVAGEGRETRVHGILEAKPSKCPRQGGWVYCVRQCQ